MRALARRLPGGCLVVSATNGKTTSAGMVADMLRRAGAHPVHNDTGANLPGGIATALLAAARRRGHIAADVGVFEVDELWLPKLAPAARGGGRGRGAGRHAGSSLRLRTPAGPAELRLALPGLYNVYNATGAAALGLAAGVPLEHVVAALSAARPVWGRAERLEAGGRPFTLMLVKNPAGANAVLRTLASEPGDLDLLGLLNDGPHDARDVSWIWDAEFGPLAARLRSATCGGTRGADLAVRLKYAGVQPGRIAVETRSLGAALELALGRAERPLFVLATYSAMMELRRLLLGGEPRLGSLRPDRR